MFFADDAALIAHSEEALQHLMSSFAHACSETGLTISLKKTNKCPQRSNRRLHLGNSGRIRVPWSPYTRQGVHSTRTTCAVFDKSRQDHIPNKDVLAKADMPSLFALLSKFIHSTQRCLQTWHEDNQHQPSKQGTQAADRSSWRTAIRTCIRTSGRRRREQWGRNGNTRSRWQKQPLSQVRMLWLKDRTVQSHQALQQPGLTLYERTIHCLLTQ